MFEIPLITNTVPLLIVNKCKNVVIYENEHFQTESLIRLHTSSILLTSLFVNVNEGVHL